MTQALIAAAFRTPRGAAKAAGSLHGLTPAGLLASHLRAVRAQMGQACDAVEDALIGCVTQTGEQGGNVGKVATLLAGWSPHMSAMTINRYCASGLSAVNLAALEALQGDNLILAGGVEMMSRVPMFGDTAPHYTDKTLIEAIGFMPPPWTSDLVATRHGISRAQCDEYAALSQARAAQARRETPMPSLLPVVDDAGQVLLAQDENIRESSTAEKLATLKAVYEGGAPELDAWALAREPQIGAIAHVHTAGNAPCMADGAAAVIVGSAGALQRHGLRPRARILASAEACVPLVQTGAVDATQKALARAGLGIADIDLWEVRDSFAAITLHYIHTLGLDLARFNVNGSSIALGHPMGATGAMLVSCLLDEMERRDLRRGVVAIAGAAGVATATVIERC